MREFIKTPRWPMSPEEIDGWTDRKTRMAETAKKGIDIVGRVEALALKHRNTTFACERELARAVLREIDSDYGY